MLEEKKENLQNATGEGEEEIANTTVENTTTIEKTEETTISTDKNNDSIEEIASEKNTSNAVIEAIENSNAEESEDESIKERHQIPLLEYDSMTMEALTDELEKLVSNEKVMAIKDHVEEIKKSFMTHFHDILDEKREEYSEQNDGNTDGFQFQSSIKTKFDDVFDTYRTKKSNHFNQLQSNLKNNFEVRNVIIDDLKNLIDSTDASIGDMFKKMNDIKERWNNAGSIPKDKYNILWNNYHFHVERFYDLIHLDKEARDQDFKNNLEQKQQLIVRAKDLLAEPDTMKAFRELQLLHRVWKEELGPVDREHRDAIWNEFSEITKQMHDKREALNANAHERELENLVTKNDIIDQIDVLSIDQDNKNQNWPNLMKKMEALRESFFKAGKVPADVNEETWSKFKTSVRKFNINKNSYFKLIKHEQQDNLDKKLALVEKAKSLKDSEDFKVTTPIMKQIQDEWKKIGHVPRKYSDSVWKDFKTECNAYFDRLHKIQNEENKEEIEAYENKKNYLETFKDFELVGDHKTDLNAIKSNIETWKSFGRVPFNKRHVEGKFNKILDGLFEKLSLSKKDTELMKFDNRLDQLSENQDNRALEKEAFFLRKKIDEVTSEILQLENNIQFITSSKKGENPFIKEVHKSIERHKDELKIWKEKLSRLNQK
ncbi:DUF349 domain-containing protein [uncultured Flavobacterium sp.]|uniref:DUF349 domain-containing protein n=1 Tax=uncultured Flavobacterium sp. TaxID=165435 RepID=UPI0030CA1969